MITRKMTVVSGGLICQRCGRLTNHLFGVDAKPWKNATKLWCLDCYWGVPRREMSGASCPLPRQPQEVQS